MNKILINNPHKQGNRERLPAGIMDRSNMSELRFEAPLAKFDTDEWNEFADENSPSSPCSVSKMSEASSSIHSDGRNAKTGGGMFLNQSQPINKFYTSD